jgi:hypothetical protein
MESLVKLMIRPRAAQVVVAFLVGFAGQSNGTPISYEVSGPVGGVSLGTAGLNCNPALACTVTITALADTNDVAPFQVMKNGNVVAAGFKNSKLSTITVKVTETGSGRVLASANILPSAEVYFSVDQTNHGAGFGSMLTTSGGLPYGPVYPLAAYGVPSYATYDLKGSFQAGGYGDFTPDGTAGANWIFPPIPTSKGDLIIGIRVEHPPLRTTTCKLNP